MVKKISTAKKRRDIKAINEVLKDKRISENKRNFLEAKRHYLWTGEVGVFPERVKAYAKKRLARIKKMRKKK